MAELKELLALLSQYADKPIIVAVVVLWGFRRMILSVLETQLSAWHKQEHVEMCGSACPVSIPEVLL